MIHKVDPNDYWFGGAEPEAYEILRDVNGNVIGLGEKLLGTVRHTICKSDGTRGLIQIVDSQPVAYFERNEIVFMLPKETPKTHTAEVHKMSSGPDWRPGES